MVNINRKNTQLLSGIVTISSSNARILLFVLIALFTNYSTSLANYFTENKGQWDENIRFFAQSTDADIWFADDGIYFEYYKYENITFDINNKLADYQKFGQNIKLELNGADLSNILKSDKVNFKINYFKGSSNNYTTNLSSYNQITYKNIYKDVDLKFYFIDGYLHYDFIINAYGNANVNDIKISFSGVDLIDINDDYIKIKTDLADIYHKDIYAFQSINGIETKVPVKFIYDNGKIGFKTDNYDKNTKLIIDPMIFSTLIGGNDYDIVRDIATDSKGSSYITGYTSSKNFPTTIGAYQTSFKNSTYDFPDIFVSKFDSTGTKLIFSTFIGSFGDDYAESIKVDNIGNIYLTGYTWAIGTFPLTAGVYDTLGNEGYDIFALKLNDDGSKLLYSTLISGEKDDFANDLAIDELGNAYITGYVSHESKFPLTTGAYKSPFTGKYDAIALKLSPDAKKLIYSAHISGTFDDFGQSITIDSEKNAYIVGITRSSDFPTTSNAYQRKYNDTSESDKFSDVFVVKLNANGTNILNSTYLGGISKDAGYGIAFDKNKNVIISGYTESVNFPITESAFDQILNDGDVNAGIGDIFVSKLTKDLSSLIFSTYIGGAGSEIGNDIVIDDNDYSYIVGATNSNNFPVTKKAFQKARKDTNLFTDAFLVKLNPNGSKVTYSTYLGGTGNDIAFALNYYYDGTVFLTGRTNSPDFPVSALVFDETYNDSLKSDVFVARIKPNAFEVDAGGVKTICKGESAILGNPIYGGIGKLTYKWEPENWLNFSDKEQVIATPDTSMVYTLTVSDQAGNIETDEVIVIVKPLPEASIKGNFLTKKDMTDIYYAPKHLNYSYSWNVVGGSILTNSISDSIAVKWGDATFGIVKLVIMNDAFCLDSASLNIVLNYKHHPSIAYSGLPIFCEGDSVILDAGAGFTYYSWSDGKTTRFNTIKKSGQYFVVVVDADGYGGVSDTVSIVVNQRPDLPISGKSKCSFNSIENYKSEFNSNLIYNWSVINGVILSGQGTNEITVEWSNSNYCKVILVSENTLNCKGHNELNVKVGAFGDPKILITPSNSVYCDGDTVLLDAGFGYGLYVWNTGETNQTIRITKAGKYWLRAIDADGIIRNSDTVEINFLPRPPKPNIVFFNGYVRCIENADSFLWYLNDTIIKNEKSRQFKPTENGYYKVALMGANGCYTLSDSLLITVKSVDMSNDNISIYPNPAGGVIYIDYDSEDLCVVEILDVFGSVLLKQNLNNNLNQIDISKLANGFYILTLDINQKKYIHKINKAE